MRKLLAIALLAFAAALPAAAQAADFPETPYVPPQVDYGLEGGWYLRGSKAISYDYAPDIQTCGCGTTATGWDFSAGFGFGYEFDNGFRLDKTLDYFVSNGETDSADAYNLRAGLILGNAYVDFDLGDGDLVGYLGAGAGGAYYSLTADNSVGGTGWTWAAAAMAGIGYDMGTEVIDAGYRLVYLNELVTGDPATVNGFYSHEFRVTWRHRL